MRLQRSVRTLALTLLGVLLAATTGCRVTSQDIETWKGTVKGPGKIVAVILAEKYELELRTTAALALIEMERQDVVGTTELQRALQKLDAETRVALIDAMVPGLASVMQGQGGAAQPSDAPPSPAQIRAKDAAFLLIAHSSPASRQKLTEAVVGWYAADFNGRSLAGSYSAEQVIQALGTPAASMLANAMTARMPAPALVKVAELIAQLGDATSKQRAAERLVTIEREMESDPFLEWLKGQVREQLQAAGQVNEGRVQQAAALNRENFINMGALPAMKHLAGEDVIATRLLEIAATPDASPALVERRKNALLALTGKAKRAHLDALLRFALDNNTPVLVRDAAFDLVGDIRSEDAIVPMWPLVQSATDQRLRWRAGELVLAIGGSNIVAEFLAKLPNARDITYAPEELAGYATRMGQMQPLPTQIMRAQLRSADWWDRVIALRYFERKGDASDVAQMEALKSDLSVVSGPGWEEGYTVGKVAESAIAGLRERLQQAAAGAQ